MVEDRDLVEDELGHGCAFEVVEARHVPDGPEADDGSHRCVPHVGADEVEGPLGDAPQLPPGVEHVLAPHEQGAFAVGREPHRPALAGAVPEAASPPGQPQVRGVEVAGLEPGGRLCNRDQARRLAEGGCAEPPGG